MKLGKRLVKAFCNKIDIRIADILGIVMTAVWFGNQGGRGSDWGRCTNFTKEQGRARIIIIIIIIKPYPELVGSIGLCSSHQRFPV